MQRCGAAAGSGRRMEIHRMDHIAVGGILEMNVNGIADADADEGSRYFTIESPVAECGSFREPAFLFNSE